jgi:hypothetical protein
MLSGCDYRLLQLIGQQPFLRVPELATILGQTPDHLREHLRRLCLQGLIQELVQPDARRGHPVELTVRGLEVVAAGQGLSLETAVRACGLAGGGAAAPLGPRQSLAYHLAHTRGVYIMLLSLYRTAQRFAAAGRDDAVVEWHSAARCSRRHMRPDAYVLYRHDGLPVGLFLEYDRGTLRRRDYRAKFAAYHVYLERRLYEREYDGFPTILMVTTRYGTEDRIAQAAREARAGRGSALPLLVTTAWRVLHDPRNPDGLLGPVWRTIDMPASSPRLCWPLGTHPGYIRLAGQMIPPVR